MDEREFHRSHVIAHRRARCTGRVTARFQPAVRTRRSRHEPTQSLDLLHPFLSLLYSSRRGEQLPQCRCRSRYRCPLQRHLCGNRTSGFRLHYVKLKRERALDPAFGLTPVSAIQQPCAASPKPTPTQAESQVLVAQCADIRRARVESPLPTYLDLASVWFRPVRLAASGRPGGVDLQLPAAERQLIKLDVVAHARGLKQTLTRSALSAREGANSCFTLDRFNIQRAAKFSISKKIASCYLSIRPVFRRPSTILLYSIRNCGLSENPAVAHF